MDRPIVIALAIGLVVVGIGLGVELFAPETASAGTGVDLGPDARVIASGSFVGVTGHQVDGTVQLVVAADGTYLVFRDYEQTQGPDVFVYLTPAGTPDSGSEVSAGVKVRIDGGADGGESTVEGTFAQRLPDDIDPSAFGGVGIWCDRFRTPFGYATLQERQ